MIISGIAHYSQWRKLFRHGTPQLGLQYTSRITKLSGLRLTSRHNNFPRGQHHRISKDTWVHHVSNPFHLYIFTISNVKQKRFSMGKSRILAGTPSHDENHACIVRYSIPTHLVLVLFPLYGRDNLSVSIQINPMRHS